MLAALWRELWNTQRIWNCLSRRRLTLRTRASTRFARPTDRVSAEALKARIAALEEKVNQIFSSQTISLDDVPSDIHDGGFVVLKK